jgi:hypothetical protein
MAIVKLQNGNVLLKDGKVSCSCCAPAICCLYPAQAFYEGLYLAADLPDAIELTCEAGTYVLSKSGSTFTDGTIVVDNYFSPVYGYAIWRIQHPIPPFLGCASEIGQCLINGTFSQDQFADSYTGTYGIYDPITLTRVSLCEWTGEGVGTEDQPYTVSLIYETDYKWHVKVEIDSVNYDWIKDDPQSSPEGNFEGNFTVS